MPEALDIAVGVAVAGARAGAATARIAADLPVVGPVLRRAADDLASEGRRTRAAVSARVDVDAAVALVLEHEQTGLALERALARPEIQQLLVQALEGRLADRLTARILDGPELDRVIEQLVASPLIAQAVRDHARALAEPPAEDVRPRPEETATVAERPARAWLRRPVPNPG